jgi:CheY-like chemotaxis protein
VVAAAAQEQQSSDKPVDVEGQFVTTAKPSAAAKTTTSGVLRISVIDHGAGISPENQKRLFKEIVQFSPEKLQAGGGSGFGLFITRGIVELHGGQIWVESKGEGHGSTFVVEFPMERKVGGVNAPPAASSSSVVNGSATSSTPVALFDGDPGPVKNPPPVVDAVDGVGRAALRSLSVSFAPGTAGPPGLPQLIATRTTAAASASVPGVPLPAINVTTTPAPTDLAAAPTAAPDPTSPSAPGTSSDDAGAPPAAGSPTTMNSGKSMNSDKSSGRGRALGPTHHVLVVDDSAMSRKMLVKILKKDAHTCEEAEDGVDAVDKAKAKLASGDRFFDAILMDFVMPNMDGPDATAAIRALGVACPIFGVTGNTLDQDVKRFMNSGATDVYGKPFDMARFTSDMRAVSSRSGGGGAPVPENAGGNK